MTQKKKVIRFVLNGSQENQFKSEHIEYGYLKGGVFSTDDSSGTPVVRCGPPGGPYTTIRESNIVLTEEKEIE